MATHFQIIKGRYDSFFNPDGSCTEKLLKHRYENCWYLATDTAEVFVCLRDPENNTLVLRKINECRDFDSDADVSALVSSIESLKNRVTTLENASSDNNLDYGEIF